MPERKQAGEMVSNSAVQNVWREDNHRLAQGDVCLFAHAGAQHGMRPGKGAAHGEMDGVLLRAACLRVAGGREYCCRRMRYNEAAAASLRASTQKVGRSRCSRRARILYYVRSWGAPETLLD